MPVVCPGGSEPYPAAIEVAYFEAADTMLLADWIGSPLLDVVLFPFLDSAFDVATLCNSDPPDPPTFVNTDFINPAALTGKLQILIQSYMWQLWCRCKAVITGYLSDWDSPVLNWYTFVPQMLDPAAWNETHLPHGDWYVSGPEAWLFVAQETAHWWLWFHGDADSTPFPNNGRPLNETALSDPAHGIHAEYIIPGMGFPGGDGRTEGYWYIYGYPKGDLLGTFAGDQVLGAFMLGPLLPTMPDAPVMPTGVTPPTIPDADLADVQRRLQGIEQAMKGCQQIIETIAGQMLDLMAPITLDLGNPKQSITASLPGLVGVVAQAIGPRQIQNYTVTFVEHLSASGHVSFTGDGVYVEVYPIPPGCATIPGDTDLHETFHGMPALGYLTWWQSGLFGNRAVYYITTEYTSWLFERSAFTTVSLTLMPGAEVDVYKVVRNDYEYTGP